MTHIQDLLSRKSIQLGNVSARLVRHFVQIVPSFAASKVLQFTQSGLTTKASAFFCALIRRLFRLSYLADHHAGPFLLGPESFLGPARLVKELF